MYSSFPAENLLISRAALVRHAAISLDSFSSYEDRMLFDPWNYPYINSMARPILRALFFTVNGARSAKSLQNDDVKLSILKQMTGLEAITIDIASSRPSPTENRLKRLRWGCSDICKSLRAEKGAGSSDDYAFWPSLDITITGLNWKLERDTIRGLDFERKWIEEEYPVMKSIYDLKQAEMGKE